MLQACTILVPSQVWLAWFLGRTLAVRSANCCFYLWDILNEKRSNNQMRNYHFSMVPKKVRSEVLDIFEYYKGLFVNRKIVEFGTLQYCAQNDIIKSSLASYFCVSMVAIEWSEAKVYNINSPKEVLKQKLSRIEFENIIGSFESFRLVTICFI